MYECRAPDEEAQDLICTACYPDGDNGHYNCSCWASQQPESVEVVYLTCQDALDKGETESGVYTLKPDDLPAFQVIHFHHFWNYYIHWSSIKIDSGFGRNVRPIVHNLD